MILIKKILLLILILNVTISVYSQKVISPDGNFKYSIPYKNETGTDLLKTMQKINPLIIDIHIIKTKKGNISITHETMVNPLLHKKFNIHDHTIIITILKIIDIILKLQIFIILYQLKKH